MGLIFLLPYALNMSDEIAWRFISMVFMTTFLIPLMGILLLKFTRNISNLNMEDKKERIFPFLFNAIFYGATTYLFWEKFRFPNLVTAILLSITLSIVILTVITIWWKISAHAIAIAGATGIYLALLLQSEPSNFYYAVAACFLLCGLVGSARLQLAAHDSKQVWYGLLIGFFVNFLTILILN
ncbi:PA-phosphatase [Marivirga arenosa]|uniref:PA-phosphatase n=1 Tax=Marivirga arenosa TaxID=3059076 RepID=A0AA51N6Y4_9BACT|nr:PA-phosphatase [Marivirga sp. ABR2-2]WMN07079.1 PA-phosphatase [Marivirga sp. ABR2-2]